MKTKRANRPVKSLNLLRSKIEEESYFIDIKPYSHNIVSLLLAQIQDEYGRQEMNSAIHQLGLVAKGWSLSPDYVPSEIKPDQPEIIDHHLTAIRNQAIETAMLTEGRKGK
jgi:hypothetical protein